MKYLWLTDQSGLRGDISLVLHRADDLIEMLLGQLRAAARVVNLQSWNDDS